MVENSNNTKRYVVQIVFLLSPCPVSSFAFQHNNFHYEYILEMSPYQCVIVSSHSFQWQHTVPPWQDDPVLFQTMLNGLGYFMLH